MADPILLEQAGHVATLTLNRPDKRNAMSEEMTVAFPRAIEQIRAMHDVRAVIVTGAGSAFCAGGDLDFLHSGPSDVPSIRDKMAAFYPAFLTLLDLDIPTVAAINGPAIGAGLCLALMCDIRIAAEDAPMGMTFVRIGLHPGMKATALLLRAVGHTWAAELFYTGRTLSGEEAERIGLVTRVVPPGEEMGEARAVAAEVAQNAPIALRYLKRGLQSAFEDAMRRAAEWESFAQPVTMATQDVREGIASVRERRRPRFTGH